MLKTHEGAVSAGAPVAPQVGRLRFEDAATDVVNDYKSNKRRSLGDLERRLKLHLTPFFGHRRTVSIGTSDVLAYTAERLKADASNAQINRELAVLKRMFVLAIKGKRIVATPHIPMLVEDNTRTGFFEREQFDSVRAHLPAEVRGVVTLAYYSGWRIGSEVLPLTWAQVDRTAGVVRLEPGTTKNRRGDTVGRDRDRRRVTGTISGTIDFFEPRD
jgi:integrase